MKLVTIDRTPILEVDTGRRYCTRTILLDLAAHAEEWEYDNQIAESVSLLADLMYPVVMAMKRHDTFGEPCEEHIRAAVHIQEGVHYPASLVMVDMPTQYWDELPRFDFYGVYLCSHERDNPDEPTFERLNI